MPSSLIGFEVTADCSKKTAHNIGDQCGARCPGFAEGAVSYQPEAE
jgi:hypothetical protein